MLSWRVITTIFTYFYQENFSLTVEIQTDADKHQR